MVTQIERFLKTKQLKKEQDVNKLSKAHFLKAQDNMKYCHESARLLSAFPSWIIVSAYYAAYHGALALLVKKGYSSKSHQATILALKELYPLSQKTILDLHTLSNIAINDLETLKEKREIANYSISISYDKIVADEMREKAQNFLFIVEDLLKH